MKLGEILTKPSSDPTPAEIAAESWIGVGNNIYRVLKEGVKKMSDDCAAAGLSNILAAMDSDTAEAFKSTIDPLRALYAEVVAEEFPAMPDQPTK